MSGVFTLERITQPDYEPVLLAEMKRHLHCFAEVTSEDTDIEALITASREWVEDYTGRILVDSTWRLTVGDYQNAYANVDSDTVSGYYRGALVQRSDGSILLRRSPILAITSFKSVNSSTGAETVIDPSTYEVREANSKWPAVYPLTGAIWTTGPLRIEFRAGFVDTSGSPSVGAVPKRLLQAMKLYCSALYDADKDLLSMYLKVAEQLVHSERSDLSLA